MRIGEQKFLDRPLQSNRLGTVKHGAAVMRVDATDQQYEEPGIQKSAVPAHTRLLQLDRHSPPFKTAKPSMIISILTCKCDPHEPRGHPGSMRARFFLVLLRRQH